MWTNSYVYETCIFVSPGKINAWNVGPANIDPVLDCADPDNNDISYVYSDWSKYNTRPILNPSTNSAFELNKTVPPLTAINDDAVTSPSAV